MKLWSELTATERNDLIGFSIGFKPATQCWFGCGGKKLIRTAWSEEQKSAAEALCRMVQQHDQIWTESLADWPSVKPEMRGRLEVIVERWHIRYSDTPGGGWEVVEWLRTRGAVVVASAGSAWRVSFDYHEDRDTIIIEKPTMAEAACLVALSYFEKVGTK